MQHKIEITTFFSQKWSGICFKKWIEDKKRKKSLKKQHSTSLIYSIMLAKVYHSDDSHYGFVGIFCHVLKKLHKFDFLDIA